MSVRESHSFLGQSIDVRRRNFPAIRVVTLNIAIAKIVGV